MLVIFTGISYKEIPVKNDQYIQGTPWTNIVLENKLLQKLESPVLV